MGMVAKGIVKHLNKGSIDDAEITGGLLYMRNLIDTVLGIEPSLLDAELPTIDTDKNELEEAAV